MWGNSNQYKIEFLEQKPSLIIVRIDRPVVKMTQFFPCSTHTMVKEYLLRVSICDYEGKGLGALSCGNISEMRIEENKE